MQINSVIFVNMNARNVANSVYMDAENITFCNYRFHKCLYFCNYEHFQYECYKNMFTFVNKDALNLM